MNILNMPFNIHPRLEFSGTNVTMKVSDFLVSNSKMRTYSCIIYKMLPAHVTYEGITSVPKSFVKIDVVSIT